jgi:hypothetical protein
VRVKLSQQEIDYLYSRPRLSVYINSRGGIPVDNTLEISEDAADAIRDELGEQLQIEGFDSEHRPTEAGRILEALIDKFYVG